MQKIITALFEIQMELAKLHILYFVLLIQKSDPSYGNMAVCFVAVLDKFAPL
jgi:hypothetical protein